MPGKRNRDQEIKRRGNKGNRFGGFGRQPLRATFRYVTEVYFLRVSAVTSRAIPDAEFIGHSQRKYLRMPHPGQLYFM